MSDHSGFIKTYWQNAQSSLWFIPALLALFATSLASLFLFLDHRYYELISTHFFWLFSGSPSAARTLLATIASAAITVISIAFSLTVLAIQQAAVQFTPRVLRTFTSDKGNQLVLGTYISTFLYSLLVLRAVRDPLSNDDIGFVPSVATSFALLLAVLCVALLIYFINHIASSLQAATVIGRVHQELIKQIDHMYPEQIGQETKRKIKEKESEDGQSIEAAKGGFVIHIEEDNLLRLDKNGIRHLYVYPKVGEFVVYGQVIARIIGPGAEEKENQDRIKEAIIIDNERSSSQDPMFPIRQLVDIALKALSPGINDQTTADYCIRYLGDALSHLADRDFPSSLRVLKKGDLTLHLNKPTWDEFVLGSFLQIQHVALGDAQVSETILRMLAKVADRLPGAARAQPISDLLQIYREYINEESPLPADTARLSRGIAEVESAMRNNPNLKKR